MYTDVSLEDPKYLDAVLSEGSADRVIFPAERIPAGDWAKTCGKIRDAGMEPVMALPYVFRDAEIRRYFADPDSLVSAGAAGFLLRNLDEAGFFRENEIPGRRIFDAGMYTWNHASAEMMRALGADELTLPYELNLRELGERGIRETDTLIVYGRIPLMVSAQCTKKNTGACLKELRGRKKNRAGKDRTGAAGTAFSYLTDRKGAKFPEDSRCGTCYTVLYNSVPLWLADRVPEKITRIRLHFTDEPEKEILRVIRAVRAGEGPGDVPFTRGHFMRGVE